VTSNKKQLEDDEENNEQKISGTRWVKDEDTEKPIKDATVEICWNDGTTENKMTNEEGAFSFSSGVSGSSSITITHEDYETYTGIITLSDSTDQAADAKPSYEYECVEYYAEVRWRYVKTCGC
jgi:hypothetical protein